jgi:hypothetical protein
MSTSFHRLDQPLNDAKFLLALGIDPGNPDEWPEPWHERHRKLLLFAIAAIALMVCGFFFLSFDHSPHPALFSAASPGFDY